MRSPRGKGLLLLLLLMITLMKFIMMLFSYHLYHIIVFLLSVMVDLIYIYSKKDERRMNSLDVAPQILIVLF
jgi:hypothetical protein